MAQPDVNKIAEQYSGILKEIGADLDSEGMKETPLRAAKALVEMTEGSRMETDQLTKMFKAECQTAICHDMVIVEGIKEVGLCEHHLLPIIMNITIAYVPDKKMLGLSKLSRIAGYFARRLLSYAVTQRTNEIGVRMALGATSKDILLSFGGRGLKFTVAGLAVGLVLAVIAARFMTVLFYGFRPHLIPIVAVASLVLFAVAALACFLPARRAAKVDPMEALRHE